MSILCELYVAPYLMRFLKFLCLNVVLKSFFLSLSLSCRYGSKIAGLDARGRKPQVTHQILKQLSFILFFIYRTAVLNKIKLNVSHKLHCCFVLLLFLNQHIHSCMLKLSTNHSKKIMYENTTFINGISIKWYIHGISMGGGGIPT